MHIGDVQMGGRTFSVHECMRKVRPPICTFGVHKCMRKVRPQICMERGGPA